MGIVHSLNDGGFSRRVRAKEQSDRFKFNSDGLLNAFEIFDGNGSN
jgi:hypothetical protein